MPRRNNRPSPPSSKHALDHWMSFCRRTIKANITNKKDNCNKRLIDTKKGR